jgi:Na+(H+)/acetate symporter ActP
MWEGWTKNLALLFAHPARLAFARMSEFALIVLCVVVAIVKLGRGDRLVGGIAAGLAMVFLGLFWKRIRRAHFDWLSSALAIFGLPLFAILLLNSDISHKRGSVRWKGREYKRTNVAVEETQSERWKSTA